MIAAATGALPLLSDGFYGIGELCYRRHVFRPREKEIKQCMNLSTFFCGLTRGIHAMMPTKDVFYSAKNVVRKLDFNPDEMGVHFRKELGVDRDDCMICENTFNISRDQYFNISIDQYTTDAWAIKDYLNSNNL